MENNNISSSFQSGLLSLPLVARLLQKSIDPSQLLHEFDPEVESHPELIDTQLQRAAKSIGFKSKSDQTNIEKIDGKVFPIFALYLDGHYFVVAKPQQMQLKRGCLDALTEGHYLLLTPRSVLLKANNYRFTMILINKIYGSFVFLVGLLDKYRYWLLWVVIFSPVLIPVDKEYPIVQREVIYDYFEMKDSRFDAGVYGYIAGEKKVWNISSAETYLLSGLKKGQVVLIKSEMCNEKNHCGLILKLQHGTRVLIDR
ncbi:hypothetical protein [Pseudoalteromonas rubra]|uniref:hypothetical protein n=1 Tax=Pseudoalteromonas rubra TaxID=43658 RepID=UPI00110870FE|nr:hypothetical protein [Pseudoalteromonas rubra]